MSGVETKADIDIFFGQSSSKFELVINLKTAKTLGLTVPPSLRVGADRKTRMIAATRRVVSRQWWISRRRGNSLVDWHA